MKIGIVGLGLIGGSLGRAIIKKTDHDVYGHDICEKTIEMAKMISAINHEINSENIENLDILYISIYTNSLTNFANGTGGSSFKVPKNPSFIDRV